MKNKIHFLLWMVLIIISTSVSRAQWVQIGPPGGRVLSLAVNGSNVFAGTDSSGVYRSTDNGQNWSQTSFGNGRWVSSIAVSASNVFAAADYRVYRSTDTARTGHKLHLINGLKHLLSAVQMFL